MERYLLFDPGCSLCTELAETIEQEARGWLRTESLRKPTVRALLRKAKPNWRWQPTLLEVNEEKVSVFVGSAMVAKMAVGLGPRSAWHIFQTLQQLDMPSKDRRQFLSQSGGLIGAMTLLSVVGLPASFLGKTKIENWKQYHDKEYDFALEFPADWSVITDIQQPTALVDAEAIIKRLVVSTASACIYIDLWQANGRDFNSWLKWYAETRLVKDLPTTPIAQVAGQPAVTYLEVGEPDWMSVFFADGQYVYRVIGNLTSTAETVQAYWHMLDTFILSGKVAQAASIPAGIRREVEQIAGSNAPLGDNICCNYTNTGNPFECCVNGNCVWWAYYKMGSVPFTGNAGSWWGQVPNFVNWIRHTTMPAINNRSIAWRSGIPGHVAYINSYTSGSNVTITDMCCGPDGPLPKCWDCARAPVSMPKSSYNGFIYRAPGNPPANIEE